MVDRKVHRWRYFTVLNGILVNCSTILLNMIAAPLFCLSHSFQYVLILW